MYNSATSILITKFHFPSAKKYILCKSTGMLNLSKLSNLDTVEKLAAHENLTEILTRLKRIGGRPIRRQPQRAVNKAYEKIYLKEVNNTNVSDNNNNNYDCTSNNNITYEVTPNTNVQENLFEDDSMLLILTNFPSSGFSFKKPRKITTNNPDQVSIVRSHKGKATFVLFYDSHDVYVCGFGLEKKLHDEVKKVSRRRKLQRDANVYGDMGKKVRAMLVFKVAGFDRNKKKLSVFLLSDYIGIIGIIERSEKSSNLLPGPKSRMLKYLRDAQAHFNAEKAEINEKLRIAETVTKLFSNVDAEDVLSAEEDGGTFLLDQRGLAGGSIARKVGGIGKALKMVAYRENMPHTNRAIDECHSIMTKVRRIKKRQGRSGKLPGKKLEIPSKVEQELKDIVEKHYSVAPTLTEMERMVRESTTVPFDSPERWNKQVKNDKDLFRKKTSKAGSYLPLLPLWHLRKEIFMQPVKSWEHFVKLLLSEQCVSKWIRFLAAAYAVAKMNAPDKKQKKHDGEPMLAGETLDPVVDLLLEQRDFIKDGVVKAHYMQLLLLLLLLMLPRWFSARQTTCLIVNIISKHDFDKRMKTMPNIKEINHVIDFIRTGDGPLDYRVRISHGKKRGRGGSRSTHFKDIDYEGEELRKYHSLLELLPECFWAYSVLTGHAVTHDSSEPRNYISQYQPKIGRNKGWHRVLKCHQFPMMFPQYHHGSKHFLSPTVLVEGADVWAYVGDVDEILPDRFRRANKWSRGMAKEVENLLLNQNVHLRSDGQDMVETSSLKPMPFPNKARQEACCLFYDKNTTQSSVADGMRLLNDILGQVINSGITEAPVRLEAKHFGGAAEYYEYVYTGAISEHLRVIREQGCRLEFKFLGRYGSGVLTLIACDHLIERLRSRARAVQLLERRKRDTLREEDHDNANVVINSYAAFKTDKLRPFAQLYNPSFRFIEIREDFRSKVKERMASHPQIKPTMDKMPNTFVAPKREGSAGLEGKGSASSLKKRCSSMEQLSIVEQNAQIRYLSYQKRIRDLMRKLAADGEVRSNEQFKLVQKELEDEVAHAGKLWEEKWGGSLLSSVVGQPRTIAKLVGGSFGGIVGGVINFLKRKASDFWYGGSGGVDVGCIGGDNNGWGSEKFNDRMPKRRKCQEPE